MSKLFGTDGIRGVANQELSGELAYRLGRAAVIVLTEQEEARPRIAVGRDTRASGEFLEAALTAGICSAGGDAVLLGVCTTPAVAFLTTDLEAQANYLDSFLQLREQIRREDLPRHEQRFKERLNDPAVDVFALYGALEADVQDRAIAPLPAGRRKVVLATSIAETSLTILGVRIVVDSGLARGFRRYRCHSASATPTAPPASPAAG